MKEPILVIMAAGMGSRYGGPKQMDPIGENGEVILDYSLYDARRAGFKRVIFLIKKEIEKDFRERVGDKVEQKSGMDVLYAFQELGNVPAGCKAPDGRTKPYGTAHAVLCCKDLIDAPFAVVNADDYYGVTAFSQMYERLTHPVDNNKMGICMVGYLLENTVTDNGYVARGVCGVDENHHLVTINERTHIIQTIEGCMYTEDGQTYHCLPNGTIVSMNLWGFPKTFLDTLTAGFADFFKNVLPGNPQKAEYFLPTAVDTLVQGDKAYVDVMKSEDKWFGVTYKEDKAVVVEAVAKMTKSGLYPTPLWQ